MTTIKRVLLIINLKTVVITLLAVASTALCLHFDITADFPLTLIATAVVFPIVFSIGGAYKRRENALARYGSLKAHSRAIYFATRDWFDGSDAALQEKAKSLLGQLLGDCRTLFSSPREEMEQNEDKVYGDFSRISEFINRDLRSHGLPSGEASRCNQFLSKIVIDFEDIKHIYQYRTPRSLSAFSDLFVTILPIIYGPYFAASAPGYSSGLAYVMPILFTVVLGSLDNIQEHLENPFDQVGEDDIVINAEKFVARLDLR